MRVYVYIQLLFAQDISHDLVFMSLSHLSELGFIWLTNGGGCLTDRYLSCQKVSLNTVFYIIPTPDELQNLFRLNSSTSSWTFPDSSDTSVVHPAVKSLRTYHHSADTNGSAHQGEGEGSKKRRVESHSIATFHIRVQPSLRVTERVRRSVLYPMTPLTVTAVTTTAAAVTAAGTSEPLGSRLL